MPLVLSSYKAALTVHTDQAVHGWSVTLNFSSTISHIDVPDGHVRFVPSRQLTEFELLTAASADAVLGYPQSVVITSADSNPNIAADTDFVLDFTVSAPDGGPAPQVTKAVFNGRDVALTN
ncbi:hypothetical protein [Nocardia sp. NBC_00511]|uniref:hypothetical protein n=1 Tax=Nocardia sp. NBC_00511 TaxID=2903591 RepID=UPI0030E5F327